MVIMRTSMGGRLKIRRRVAEREATIKGFRARDGRLADLRIRHGQANHRRETIAFSKRRQRAMERQAVFTVWANCIKKKSEKKGETTSAMEVGLLGRPLTWEGILKRRLFPAQIRMCREWRAYYAGKVKTLALGAQQTEHLLKYAV